MAVVLPVRQGTPEWLAAREHGIGASQAAAAIGVSEWQSPIGLWAEKLGLVPPQPANVNMEIGQALEPLIARKYTEATGVKVRRANNLRQHPTHAFMLASLDRRAGRKPIELKYSARAVGYGEPGTDEVPDDVLVQVLHQLAVVDEAEGEVALLKPGAEDVLIYVIARTPEAEAAIVEREGAFWEHVQSRTEPAVDGSEATKRALAAMYPRLIADHVLEVPADSALEAALAELRDVRGRQDADQLRRDEIEASIKAAMLREKATLVRADGVGEIPWRATKPRETTNWQPVAGAYRTLLEDLAVQASEAFTALLADRGLEELAAVEALHTETKATAPRFGPPKWQEEE